jgi:hypothetical protein
MSNAVRIALKGEIEFVREKFHRFLVTIPEETLRLPSKDPAWTNGELLYLMSTSPRILKSLLRKHTSQNTRFHYVSKIVTGPLLQKTNEILIRARGYKITRWSIAEDYDSTNALILAGQITIESVFHYVKNHFYAYRKQVNVVKQPFEN